MKSLIRKRCGCEGCSWLGWLIVRLPEPLYRLTKPRNRDGGPS